MSEKESDSEQQLKTKLQKLNNDDDQIQSQNQATVAGPSNEESPPLIFKMDIDCFEELFEWLSISDLLALRRTCKRFKKIIDYHIKTNYPEIGKFRLSEGTLKRFQQMDEGTIELINKIEVSVGKDFNAAHFESIKELLKKVEKIIISSWTSDPDFYNVFLKHCKSVKHLVIKGNKNYFPCEVSDDWLSHHYPSLEYVNFGRIPKEKINEYMAFFRLNPNITALGLDIKSLERVGLHFLRAGIKFDRLFYLEWWITKNGLDLLKQLHDGGFYKRLQLTFEFAQLDDEDDEDYELDLNVLTSIGVEVINGDRINFTIPPLPRLKEIDILEYCEFYYKYENVKNVVERFNTGGFGVGLITKLIGNFPKLKHFQIESIYDANQLNLTALNNEREKLAGACKTTIYVDEYTFLTTKWASLKTNLSLIELKRMEACCWEDFFQ